MKYIRLAGPCVPALHSTPVSAGGELPAWLSAATVTKYDRMLSVNKISATVSTVNSVT